MDVFFLNLGGDEEKERIILKSNLNLESEDQKYMLKFYKSYANSTVEPRVHYGKYDYLKEYIDSIVQYKSENEIDTISLEELENLKWDFLVESIPNIHLKYQNMYDEEEERIQTIMAERKRRSDQLGEITKRKESGAYVKNKRGKFLVFLLCSFKSIFYNIII